MERPKCLAPWTVKYYGIESQSVCTTLNDLGMPIMDYNGSQYKTLRKAFYDRDPTQLPAICRECAADGSPDGMAKFYRRDIHKDRYDEIIGLYDPSTGEMAQQKIAQYLVNLSNKCNQACRMCTEYNSDVIGAHRKQMGLSVKGKIRRDNVNYLDEFKQQLPYIKEISFHGGEPILHEATLELLKLALPYKDTLRILFMFNGKKDTFTDGSTLYHWANQYPFFRVPLSIDGTRAVNDYIRKGSDYDRTYAALRRLRKEAPHTIISIRHTLSNLNIRYLPEFIDEAPIASQGMYDYISIGKVIVPRIYSPYNLPDHQRKEIMTKLSRYANMQDDDEKRQCVQIGMRYLVDGTFDPEIWAKFVDENRRKDQFYGDTPIIDYQ